AGVGRESAHEAIREHAVAVALAMREQGQADNDLLDRLAGDDRIPLGRDELDDLLAAPLSFTGTAQSQVDTVIGRVEDIVARFPEAASYTPAPILGHADAGRSARCSTSRASAGGYKVAAAARATTLRTDVVLVRWCSVTASPLSLPA